MLLLSTSYDIICLHEIWLLNTELSLLNNIVPGFHGFGVSPTDSSAGFVRGRPFGGVAILCRDSVFCKSHIIYTDNTWSVALQCFNNRNDKFTIVNVYMPCDSYENVDNYSEFLGYLSALMSDIEGKYVIV